MNYTSNPDLKTILPPEKWKGTPINDQKRFVNHEHPFSPSFLKVLQWKLKTPPQKHEKKSDSYRLTVHHSDSFLKSNEDCIVWLGHASFFIRLNGITLLTDPVYFNMAFLKRFAEMPVNPSEITGIDYILISHDHYDHTDVKSLKLLSKNNPKAEVITGLNMEKMLRKLMTNPIQMAGWNQQYKTDESKLKLYFLPARHWARRSAFDTNKRLWGAFVIESSGKKIYFSGDTGYGNHFKEASEIFPEIDYFICGTGAYSPKWFMEPIHISPEDAVKAANDMKAKNLIPMHYATFDLSDEPFGEPVRILQNEEKAGRLNGKLKIMDVGEILSI